ncbi:MAG TPA: BrnT family toxin [Candidatus Omnitrophota bacterium]|jgi:uncharacterized DUF497 family protein|nr:BrnT family toxin [Candidatus Omnitrophota bacterium]HPN56152.1 BrnT family toxin [Candidatus Omnitrophota bacterium]
MDKLHFIWDEGKNKLNQKKHGISFEEAKTVFFDENAVEFSDPDHSQEEDRFILLGFSFKLRILIVCYCYRENDSTIRIYSARKATKNESLNYGRGDHENRI